MFTLQRPIVTVKGVKRTKIILNIENMSLKNLSKHMFATTPLLDLLSIRIILNFKLCRLFFKNTQKQINVIHKIVISKLYYKI